MPGYAAPGMIAPPPMPKPKPATQKKPKAKKVKILGESGPSSAPPGQGGGQAAAMRAGVSPEKYNLSVPHSHLPGSSMGGGGYGGGGVGGSGGSADEPLTAQAEAEKTLTTVKTIVSDPDLPPGWTVEERKRTNTNSKTVKRLDKYYIAPTGKTFRSKLQVMRFLGKVPQADEGASPHC